jgi:hypothetical protein
MLFSYFLFPSCYFNGDVVIVALANEGSLLSVPPNVKFEIDDLEKPWTFTSGFDFVFSRMMTGSFPDWRQYINHCYE